MAKLTVLRLPGVLPVYTVFFAEGFVLGNWIPRIPDVKLLFEFSKSELGMALFAVSFGTLFSFVIGGALVKRLGLRGLCMVASPIWALFIAAIPFAPNGYMVGVVGALAGFFVGLTEIGMNTACDKLEGITERRLMSKAHGFWSLGSLVGAIIGAQFVGIGLPVSHHFIVMLPLIALVSLYASYRFPQFKNETAAQDAPTFKLPNRAIVLLCVMPIGVMLIEGAFIDWSALFVRDVLDGGAFAIGSIFAAFATVMTVTRLCGDTLIDRFGSYNVARVSTISATLGIGIFALSTTVPMAFVGALFSGLGVAIIYPLVISAAAKRPGDAEDNVAAMSLFAFTSFMVAPPAIGFIADFSSLTIALALLIPIAATSFFLSGELNK